MTTLTPTGDSALRRCVACSADEFAVKYWGRRPLLSRAAELDDTGDPLFSLDAADELISVRGLRTPFVRMARDGQVVASGGFTRSGGAGAGIADQAGDDKVLTRLVDGTTLVLQALHRVWPPVVEFNSQLAAELGHPVQINAYITPPASQGFAPHYDTHDVFVWQLRGEKHWTVHEPVITDPLDAQPFGRRSREIADRVTGGPALIDERLQPGDVLYLPRGLVHSARALDQTSLHLTIGIHPVTRHQLVRHLADAVVGDAGLRGSLPAGVDLTDPATLGPLLDETRAALRGAVDSISVEDIAERLATDLMAQTRPEPIAPFSQLAALDALTMNSRVRPRRALRWRMRELVDGVVRLEFIDRHLDLDCEAAAAARVALNSVSGFAAGDLPGDDEAAKLTVVRQLLAAGLLLAD